MIGRAAEVSAGQGSAARAEEDAVGLAVMIAGLVLFLGIHLVSTRRGARGRLVARLGEGGYKALYGLIALAGLALIVWGFAQYRASGMIVLYEPPRALKHLTVALMLPAVILVVATYVRGHIYARLKHPMLAGVKLWALAHLLANGDLGSLILFGAVLAWAVIDRISLKRRTDPGAPAIPVGGWGNDAIAVAVGIVAYLALGYAFHPVVIGVPVFGV
jgi:uncharacterized membrane protein